MVELRWAGRLSPYWGWATTRVSIEKGCARRARLIFLSVLPPDAWQSSVEWGLHPLALVDWPTEPRLNRQPQRVRDRLGAAGESSRGRLNPQSDSNSRKAVDVEMRWRRSDASFLVERMYRRSPKIRSIVSPQNPSPVHRYGRVAKGERGRRLRSVL